MGGEAANGNTRYQEVPPQNRAGNTQHNTVVSDHARAHLGDVYHNCYHLPQAQKQIYDILYESLAFDRMNARDRNVERAQPTTCQWMFSHELFLAWTDALKVDDHHGLLWIRGKPGCGKSTIMKELLAWAEKEWSTQEVIPYFFNARAPGQLEKSSLGLYRSVVQELLSTLPTLHQMFSSRFASKIRDSRVEDWTEVELQGFLIETITATPTVLPPVNLFVDALDEGDEEDVSCMLKFLEQLGQRAVSSGVQLRICLSSRYYPNITIEKGLFIFLDKEAAHTRDIETYIAARLPDIRSSDVILREEVSRRSGGVFLWVILVVQMLVKMHNQGKRAAAMIKALGDTPAELHDLFARLVDLEGEGFQECVTLFRWVMFSMEPLTPIELYLAVHQAHAPEDMEDAQCVDAATATRYILTCSRGLIETIRLEHPDGVRTVFVQFIHETVRGYVMEQNMLSPSKSCTPYSCSISTEEFCDMTIVDSSLRYLVGTLIYRERFETDDEGRFSVWRDQYAADMRCRFPLLDYTSMYWWKHLVRSSSVCSQDLLELASDLLAIKDEDMRNLILVGPICHRHPEDEPLMVSPLYLATIIGVPELVSSILARGANVNGHGGPFGNALYEASYNGNHKVVEMLIQHGANINAEGGPEGCALAAASSRGYLSIVKLLLEKGADVSADAGVSGSVFAAACNLGGHLDVVRLLLQYGADVSSRSKRGSVLFEAIGRIFRPNTELVRLLLDLGAEIDVSRYGTLYDAVATYDPNVPVVQLILERGAGIIPQTSYDCALKEVLNNKTPEQRELVQLLLDAGADPTLLQARCPTFDISARVAQRRL